MTMVVVLRAGAGVGFGRVGGLAVEQARGRCQARGGIDVLNEVDTSPRTGDEERSCGHH